MTLILNGTDGISDVDGTAATPAIRGTDTNTGIFFPAADTIAFAEGGVESMRINSAGNVQLSTAGIKILNSSGNPILQQTGSVLQVVNMRTSTVISFSNTEQSTGLTASITPSSASNKILVIANNNGLQSYAGSGVSFYLYRGATFIYNFGSYYGYPSGYYGSGAQVTYLDSPATTSSVTYNVNFQRTIGGTGGVVNGDGSNSFLTLLEIAA
jgi:hypothetical protein